MFVNSVVDCDVIVMSVVVFSGKVMLMVGVPRRSLLVVSVSVALFGPSGVGGSRVIMACGWVLFEVPSVLLEGKFTLPIVLVVVSW